MGTSDELALDVLINALSVFSREQLGVRQLVVGGQNEDWPTPQVRRRRRLPTWLAWIAPAGIPASCSCILPLALLPAVRRLSPGHWLTLILMCRCCCVHCCCCCCLQREDFLPEVTMDPLRGPQYMGRRGGVGEDGEEDDEEDADDRYLP